MRYFARISYDGSHFEGFQRLKNGRGVQNEIEHVLSVLAHHEVKVKGAGRTDRGVHALDQCIHFDFDLDISLDKLQYILNRNLTDGIVVNSIEKVSNSFHARKSVIKKTYEYVFLLKEKNPFLSNYTWTIYQDLDISKMKEASKVFLGRHNFQNFVSGKRDNYETEIYDIQFSKNGNELRISFIGLAFYRYMVRHLVGALLDVGMGKVNIFDLKDALENPQKKVAFSVALPNGLYLKQVEY